MPRYIAFLRGINLGKRRIKMDRLRELFEELKLGEVSTFIASGNVMFSSTIRDGRKLEKTIESHLAKRLGYNVDTFIRTRREVGSATACESFPAGTTESEENTIHVGFLKEALSPKQAEQFVACRTPVDELATKGREFFWLCRIRTPDSKVWSSPAMRALRIPTVTMRNLKMLRRLVAEFPAE